LLLIFVSYEELLFC